MQLVELIEAMCRADAYRHEVGDVEVHQTHISVVFLAEEFAYKIKKPVRLGFLDYGTLQRRRHFCEEEVRLNRRLAASVYLGVVGIAKKQGGGLQVEGAGEIVEWAVKMKRLPREASFADQVDRGVLTHGQIEQLARRVASFHVAAERGDRIAAFGRSEAVAANVTEALEQVPSLVGQTVSPQVLERLRILTEQALRRLAPRMEDRVRRGVPCDTHGDLRLEHVYLLPEATGEESLVVVDCIEFNERFRFADPAADVAFVVMDLIAKGRRDLAEQFVRCYVSATGDLGIEELLPLYVSYRAAVRAKVEGIELGEPEVSEDDRRQAFQNARGHWLLALGALEVPRQRPCLVLIGGLPGSGKSTLATALAKDANMALIRSDVVRKELAGLEPGQRAASPFEEGIYSAECTRRTYEECLHRAEARLFEGQRVILDASFRHRAHRAACLQAAKRWGVPAVFLLCQADPAVIRERLAARRQDVSDADWAISQRVTQRWEGLDSPTQQVCHVVDTSQDSRSSLEQTLDVLRAHGLFDGHESGQPADHF